jgi:site-specific DNA-cytosine methylase
VTIEYTALFLFCGLGGNTLGFQASRARMFGQEARFRSIGGIDNDPLACADFEYLTKSPALCTDISTLTPGKLRAFAGNRAPDAAFGSAPCKSHSGLTNPGLAATQKYVDMAQLYVSSIDLLLSTWDIPPRLIILENVPRILSSGARLIAEVTTMLEAAGYAVDISTHDCGEIGGLAQRRRRALQVGGLKRSVPTPLMRPKLWPVRSCGSVLGELPMPEDPRAGPMHRMPRIGWLTWMRLAMIPAGGDYRDLQGALDGLNASEKRGAVTTSRHGIRRASRSRAAARTEATASRIPAYRRRLHRTLQIVQISNCDVRHMNVGSQERSASCPGPNLLAP